MQQITLCVQKTSEQIDLKDKLKRRTFNPSEMSTFVPYFNSSDLLELTRNAPCSVDRIDDQMFWRYIVILPT